jgi:hypothetical protein
VRRQAFTHLTKRLKPLERYAGSPEEFKDLCFLLTCKNIQDAPSFKNWDGAKGNSRCAAHFPPPPVQATAGHSSFFFALLRSSSCASSINARAARSQGARGGAVRGHVPFGNPPFGPGTRLARTQRAAPHTHTHTQREIHRDTDTDTTTTLCHTITGGVGHSQRRQLLLGRAHRGFATQPHAALATPGRGLSDGVYALPPQGRAQDQHVRTNFPFLHTTAHAHAHTHHRTRRLA